MKRKNTAGCRWPIHRQVRHKHVQQLFTGRQHSLLCRALC